MREDILKKLEGAYSNTNNQQNNPAISNAQKDVEEQKGFASAMQKIVNNFENSIIGKAFKAPSKIMQNTFNELQKGDGSFIGDAGVILKGGAEAAGTALRTGGSILNESWRDIGSVADTEMAQDLLGTGGSKILKAGTTGAGLASEMFANSLAFQNPAVDMADKIIDVSKLSGDILALTDGKTSGKELIQDAIYTALDFAPEITNAAKNSKLAKAIENKKATKTADKIISNTDTLNNITDKKTSLKASADTKNDIEYINNLTAKKRDAALILTNNKEELAEYMADDYMKSLDKFNQVKKDINAVYTFDNELNEKELSSIAESAKNNVLKKYKNKILDENQIKTLAEEKAVASFGDNVVNNEQLVKKVNSEIKKITKEQDKILKKYNVDVDVLEKQLKDKKLRDKAEEEFFDFIDSYSRNSKENRTQNKELTNKLFDRIYKTTLEEDASFNSINNLADEFIAAVKNESNAGSQEMYKATVDFLQNKYPEEMVDALNEFRASNQLINTVGGVFKTSDKKQIRKEIKDLSSNIPDKLNENFHVFMLGDKLGVSPSTNAIKNTILSFISNGKDADKIYKNLKKKVAGSLPKETKESIITNINKVIKDILDNYNISPRGIVESTYDNNIGIQEQSNGSTSTYTTPYKSKYEEYLDSLYY